MDSNMSAAAFMHRSGGSSSTSSTGTGSSAGGPGNGSTGGSRMAVIGVTRNVRLRRRGASGFGFSLRGGREYAAGFYVSDVQPGGEAHRNGLRVGDQIIRVNGYPVEDAVHHEVALLAKNQQVLVLKIRSVGMIPVKDNPNDPVTWHMVQQQQQHQHQQYQQQIQYNESNPIPYNEVRVRVMVGEKGRLGCGVCRGLVPGLTVQGTREGGPARAAGLKAGDVITWCNGQRLTDLPFERAIEIMRGAAILDLILNRPIPPSNGLYDCPETLWMRGSSGYDSESSSLLTTSPSPPAHQNPPSPQHHHNHHHNVHPQSRYTRERDDPCNNRNGRACCPLALSTNSGSSSEWSHPSDQSPEWTRRPNNTTVIRVNQNNHLNNENQYHSNASGGDGGTSSSMVHPTNNTNHVNYGLQSETGNEPLYDPVPPRDYESHDFDANPVEERNRRLLYEKESIDLYDPPASEDHHHHHHHYNNSNNSYMGNGHSNIIQRHGEIERQTVTTVEVHQNCGPPAPPCPPPMSYKWQSEAKPMISMGKQMGSTMSMGSTGSTETESSLESCGKDSASTSSSLSTSSCDPASTITSGSTNTLSTGTIKSPEAPVFNRFAVISNSNNSAAGRPSPPVSSTDLSTAIAQEFQRRAQQRNLNAAKSEMNKMEKPIFESKKPKIPPENKVTHDKLMEEFKRAHKKMFNGNQQKVQFSEKEQEKRVVNDSPAIKGGGTPPPPPMPLPTSPLKSINNNVNGNNIINNNNNNNNNNNSKEDLVEMQSIESFKLKESPSSVIPKPPPTYFSTSDSSSPNSTPSNGSPRHSALLTKTQINNTTTTNINQQTMEKNIKTNSSSPTTTSTGSTGSTGNGKVAVKIGAYEGEAKQPSRFDFLPQQQRTVTDSVTKPAVGGEVINVTNAPVVSRLQNELAATLQRSNLRKKTNQENVSTTQMTKSPSPESINRPVTLLQNNVEKLAAALSNRVTIKLSPENESR